MIGHLVNILTREEEDRLLTSKLGCYSDGECLLQRLSGTVAALQDKTSRHYREWRHSTLAYPTLHDRGYRWIGGMPAWFHHSIGSRYDMLIDRFGTPRIANAIRNRVLANQARRTLQQESVEAA